MSAADPDEPLLVRHADVRSAISAVTVLSNPLAGMPQESVLQAARGLEPGHRQCMSAHEAQRVLLALRQALASALPRR